MFYEVADISYEYPAGYKTERIRTEAFFEDLGNAYYYCADANDGTNNTILSYDEIADELQCDGDRADVGYLTIIAHTFYERQ